MNYIKQNFIGIFLIASILILTGCNNSLLPGSNETVSVTISTGISLSPSGSRAVTEDVASFNLTISGTGMTTLQQVFTSQTVQLSVPAGIARTFKLDALDSESNIIFSGSSTIDLTAGQDTTVVINIDYAGFYINFDTMGGTAVSDIFVSADDLISVPSVSSRADYILSGWYTDAAYTTAWNLLTDIPSFDMTLYAKWYNPKTNYLTLDGLGDYVTADDVCTSLGATDEITIECWVNPADVTLDQYFIAFNGSDDSNNFQLGINTSGYLKYLENNAGVATSYTMSNSTWYHVAASIDSSDQLLIYVNGVIVDGPSTYETSSFPAFSSDGKFSIGQEWDSGPTAGNFYEGRIDDIRIWNTVRTQTQITTNMNTALTGNETGLIAYFECIDTSGIILTDSTENNNDGTIIGTFIFSDDFSTDGTLNGSTPDIGGNWNVTDSTSQSITNGIVDTSEGSSTMLAFADFSSALTTGEILTLTFTSEELGSGTFANSSWAGVSLLEGGLAGTEQFFIGNIGSDPDHGWGIGGFAVTPALLSPLVTAASQTAVFTYDYDSGAWTLSVGGSTDSGSAVAGMALNTIRIGAESNLGGNIAVSSINISTN